MSSQRVLKFPKKLSPTHIRAPLPSFFKIAKRSLKKKAPKITGDLLSAAHMALSYLLEPKPNVKAAKRELLAAIKKVEDDEYEV